QLRRDPSLVNNKQFVNDHPELKQFLQQHGGAAQDLRQNPNGFMQEEERFDRREDGADRDRSRGQLASLDNFLDSHPEDAEQVQKGTAPPPNHKIQKHHPALQTYLQQHQQGSEEKSENPNPLMQREQRVDQREGGMDRDRDRSRGQLASLDNFL